MNEVRAHLYFNGIDISYKRWIWHGEMAKDGNICAKAFDEQYFDLHNEEDCGVDMGHDVEDGFIGHPQTFEKLLKDVETPLYYGCAKFTKLSALV